jgi:hypothetical protein
MSAWLEEIMKGLGSAVAWGFAGRAMWLAQEFRAGKRKIISWALLLWELPIAICMSRVGAGIADYMTWDDTKRDALVVVVAYLGPRIIEQTWEAVKGVLPGFFQKKD